MILNTDLATIPPVVQETHPTPCLRSWGQLWGQLLVMILRFSQFFCLLKRLFSSVSGHNY
jgi:hypothetical protein